MATSIYLDRETQKMLDLIKGTEPDFNLSKFIREQLEWKATGKSESEEGTILERLNQLEIQDEVIHKQREMWQQKLIEFKEKMKRIAEQKEKERTEQEETIVRQESKKAEFFKSYIANCLYFFNMTQEQAEQMAKEVWETPQEARLNIIAEGKKRGFKEKV